MKQEWMGGDNRALAILRVSSGRQKHGTSHDTQNDEIREYCAANGLRIAATAEITESAQESEMRHQYHAAIKSALKQGIRHIVFNVFDRETRNLTDNEKNETLVREDKIVLHYARERKVMHKATPDSEWFTRDISAASNKHFIRNLRAKVSDAMRTKAEDGWYPGNRPPLGYKNRRLKDSNGNELKRGTDVVIDDRGAKIVLRIFELRADGRSLEDIRSTLVRDGTIDPARAGKFHKSHIEKILANPFYAGRFRWQGQEFDGKHPVFIPRDLLQKAQGVKRGNRARLELTEFNLFGHGFMKCAVCGLAVVYERKKGRFHLYHCSNSRRLHSLKGQIISLENVWAQMAASVDLITLPAPLAKEFARAINELDSSSTAALKNRVRALTESLEGLERREDELYDDFKAGVLDQIGHQRQIKRLRDQRAQVAVDLERAKGAMAGSFRESAESLIELCRDAKSLWIKRSVWERKEFLNCFHSNRRLNGVTIEIEMKKPFSIISKMANSKEWRPQLDVLRTALVPTLAAQEDSPCEKL